MIKPVQKRNTQFSVANVENENTSQDNSRDMSAARRIKKMLEVPHAKANQRVKPQSGVLASFDDLVENASAEISHQTTN